MGSRVGVAVLLSRRKSAFTRLINSKFVFELYCIRRDIDNVEIHILQNNITSIYSYNQEMVRLNVDDERTRYWHSVKDNYRMLSVRGQDISFGFERVSSGVSFAIYRLVDDVWTDGGHHFYDNNHLLTIRFPQLDYKNMRNLLDYCELVKEKR